MTMKSARMVFIAAGFLIVLYAAVYFSGSSQRYEGIPVPGNEWWFMLSEPSDDFYTIAYSERDETLLPGEDLATLMMRMNPDTVWIRVITWGELEPDISFRFTIEEKTIVLSGDHADGDFNCNDAHSFINGGQIEFKSDYLSDEFIYSKVDASIIKNGIVIDSFKGG